MRVEDVFHSHHRNCTQVSDITTEGHMMTSLEASPPTQRHGDQCHASACPVCWLRHFNVEEPRNTTLPVFKHSIHSVCTEPRGDLPDPGSKPDKEALPYRAIINQGRGDDNLHQHSSTSPPQARQCSVLVAVCILQHSLISTVDLTGMIGPAILAARTPTACPSIMEPPRYATTYVGDLLVGNDRLR